MSSHIPGRSAKCVIAAIAAAICFGTAGATAAVVPVASSHAVVADGGTSGNPWG